MKKEKAKPSRGVLLAIAILWTVVTAIWGVVTVLRFSGPHEDKGLQVMTMITVLASLAACVVNWLRYINDTHN